jgi:hypothetical protein
VSISKFVEETGAQMRIFDLGRRIQKISKADFSDIENLNKPYPSPYLQHAWIGILTWNPKKAGNHNIWFLKLPLDEQNFILPGDRDAFLNHWLRCLQYPDKEHGEAPCYYKPDQNRMAYFHSLALATLGQTHTDFYTTTRAYLSGDMGWENWQQLGLQGIAEVVVSIDKDKNAKLVAQGIANMPATPLNTLLGFLENIEPDFPLSVAINDRLAKVIEQGAEPADLAAFIRALSHSQNIEQRKMLIEVILLHPKSSSIEVLASIASRCWQDLEGELLLAFLNVLASNEQGQAAFNALVADLMPLPNKREHILQAFRSEKRSEELMIAIGNLMKSVQQVGN